jgi:type II secretory pathway pseudopilin PulG
MRERRDNRLIVILIVIILLLAGFLLYILVIQPKFNGYVVEKQVDAQRQVISALIQSVNQNGFVQITDASGNTIVLVPAQPTQPPQNPTQETVQNLDSGDVMEDK